MARECIRFSRRSQSSEAKKSRVEVLLEEAKSPSILMLMVCLVCTQGCREFICVSQQVLNALAKLSEGGDTAAREALVRIEENDRERFILASVLARAGKVLYTL